MQIPSTPADIQAALNLPVYERSLTRSGEAVWCLTTTPTGKQLALLTHPAHPLLSHLIGESVDRGDWVALLCPLDHANAIALRAALPWLTPRPLGLRTSAGCGDRMGLATPGHVRAARAVGNVAMIFAQQSIREMTRTGRTPDQVMDDATWGVFQEGWQEGVGADADHLKTPADIDRCTAAGFTFYTIDPGEHVDSAADADDEATLRAKYAALPWDALEADPAGRLAAYAGKQFEAEDRARTLDEATLVRASVKYGGAVAHTARMYRYLASCFPDPASFELEVSVDETDTPTTHAEHIFIATELRRLGVRWVSLAPRYVGRFEKGVDYIGDTAAFEADFAGHAAIARALGPYKLSLHSGSDKFSIYEIAARHAHGLLHLKTAGTSYLEALRATAGFDPALFREILDFARAHYETDRASYHVSARLDRVPPVAVLTDADLPGLLDQFDARQVLHVTFGTVLTSDQGYRARLLAGLADHEEAHYAALERHFIRHLRPLTSR
jgi:tagaturonate epimerase